MDRTQVKFVCLLLCLAAFAALASSCGSDPTPAAATAASDSSTGVLPNPASALQ